MNETGVQPVYGREELWREGGEGGGTEGGENISSKMHM